MRNGFARPATILDEDTAPSCSAAEALERQGLFVNQTLGSHALPCSRQKFEEADIVPSIRITSRHPAWPGEK
jgi:hypothetical protein